jgi:hypothetical protein
LTTPSLVLAASIEGFSQQISKDGAYVHYIDSNGDWLIQADARPLVDTNSRQKLLKDILDDSDLEKFYTKASIYPRYYSTSQAFIPVSMPSEN